MKETQVQQLESSVTKRNHSRHHHHHHNRRRRDYGLAFPLFLQFSKLSHLVIL